MFKIKYCYDTFNITVNLIAMSTQVCTSQGFGKDKLNLHMSAHISFDNWITYSPPFPVLVHIS